MDSIYSILSSGLTGTAIGVIGILVGVGLYLLGRPRPRMDVQYEHTTLIGGQGAKFPEEVSIYFGLFEVEKVTTSSFILWNSGNRTITGGDITGLDPLRIELPAESKILKWSIPHKTREVNGWSFELKTLNQLKIGFDYLDPRDGVRVEVTHDAAGSDIQLRGTVRGMPGGVQDRGRRSKGEGALQNFAVAIVNTSLGALYASYGIARIAGWTPGDADPGKAAIGAFSWVAIPLGVFLAYSGVLNFQIYRRKYPASLATPRT